MEEDVTGANVLQFLGFLFSFCCAKQTGRHEVLFCVAHATAHAHEQSIAVKHGHFLKKFYNSDTTTQFIHAIFP